MSEFETLALEEGVPVARIRLNRPQRLNALSRQALAELIAAADRLGQLDGLKVVIVSGEGRAFSAGFDIDSVGTAPDSDQVDLGRRMAEAVSAIPALTIAAIHGHCVGGAVVLAAACDIRIAGQDTRFAIPEVDLGIPLAWSGIPRLVRELGPAVTKELVVSCRPFTAEEALRLRFLNRVVPDEELAAEVEATAASLAAKPGFLIRHTKQLVDALVEQAYSTGQSFRDAEVTLAVRHDPEALAAMQRYLTARGRPSPQR